VTSSQELKVKQTWRAPEEGRVWELFHRICPRNHVGDTLWSIYFHHRVFGELPRMRIPLRFNEHLLRLKLSADGRSSLRARITDKELVKDFIRERLGEGYTAQTLAVLRSRAEARAFAFPETCVIKPTHSSGDVILRRRGEAIDHIRIDAWFAKNLYEFAREPNYRHLTPKVIVEELLVEPGHETPSDYKFHCFHGTAAYLLVVTNRFSDARLDFFSPRWRALAFGKHGHRCSDPPPLRPGLLEAMLAAARTLSAGFSFIRVDFLHLGSRFVVGELTNFPAAAAERFDPDEADFRAGRLFGEPTLDVERLFGLRFPDRHA
jgi:hypothetical protein